MLERSLIQSTGFANLGPPASRTGFKIRLRQPNYRGTRLSLIEGIDIVVDGEAFAAQNNRLVIGGRTFTQDEVDEQTNIRWQVGTAIDVHVSKEGGLSPGVHLVEATIWFRHPYFPPEFQPVSTSDIRHATIVL